VTAVAAAPAATGVDAATSSIWWSNWWGSPQLLARTFAGLADALTEMGGVVVEQRVDVVSGHHRERFASPDAFVAGASPEALARFTPIEGRVTSTIGDARLVLRRPRHPLISGSRDQRVELFLPAAESSAALARLIREVSWGYRPYWGASGWPAEVAPRSRYVRLGPSLRVLFHTLVAVAIGVVLAVAARHVTGSAEASGELLALSAVLSALVPLTVARGVPNIEIAQLGRTRLVALARKLLAAGVGTLAAQLVGLVLGP